jgi:hypothetical protein
MRSHTLFLVSLCIILFSSQVAFGDTVVFNFTNHVDLEQHSSRETISVGGELVSESEHTDYPASCYQVLPIDFSMPAGHTLTSAIIDFSILGNLNNATTSFSVPIEGAEGAFIPGSLNPVYGWDGPWVGAQVGDEFFTFPAGTGQTGSVDLFALGYGDALRQGAPVSLVTGVWMWVYVEADLAYPDAAWWGQNAWTRVTIDERWSGDFNETVTFTTARVPEPSTFVLLMSGIAVLLGRHKGASKHPL